MIKLILVGICCLISWILNAQQTVLPEQFLSRLIQLRSNFGKEQSVIDCISEWAKQEGFYLTKFHAGESSDNVLISIFPLSDKKPNVIFTSHLDIVPVSDSAAWKFAPYAGIVHDDTIWGRGAIDCKGLAVMQLFALKKWKDSMQGKDFPYNISFLGLVEEEGNSSNGAAFIAEKYLDSIQPIVIFGEGGAGLNQILQSEPSKPIFGISVADKSLLWLKLEAKSSGFGHGAVPSELYANKRLIKALINLIDEEKHFVFNDLVKSMFQQLGELEGGTRGFFIKRIYWSIFWPLVKKNFREGQPFHALVDNTISITKIESSSTATNQMSDKAAAYLDCRLLPGADVDKFIRKLRRTTLFRVEIDIVYQGPAAIQSPETIFFQKMCEAIKEVYPGAASVPILFPASTDNNFFRQKGIPVYGIIPSLLNQSLFESVHNQNERIGVNNLEKGIEVYYHFLKSLPPKRL
jgi:carboxypeptidase PM20D1